MDSFAEFGYCGGEVTDSYICFFQVCQILLYFFFIETALVDNTEYSSGEVFNESIGSIKMAIGMQFADRVSCCNATESTGLSGGRHSVRKDRFLKNPYMYIHCIAPVRG